MRKAKVAAIVCGVIASCLFGGFAVVDAATITLDDSSTAEVVSCEEITIEVPTVNAATVTSIETIATTSTRAKTASELTETIATDVAEIESAEITAVTMQDTEQTTTAIKAIPVVKPDSYKPPTPRETAPATEAPAAKATVQTTTKAAEVVVPSTKAPQIEEVYTNPPMPAQPTPPQTQVETAAPAPQTEPQVVIPAEPATEAPAEQVTIPTVSGVSESDYILLCNAVAHEAGANSISVTEKAKVVEVIMNRVYSPNYPNTVYGVLTQKYQFSGSSSYVNLGTFSGKVTNKVKEAVDLYFADPSVFNEGYLSFTGDGKQNYFK